MLKPLLRSGAMLLGTSLSASVLLACGVPEDDDLESAEVSDFELTQGMTGAPNPWGAGDTVHTTGAIDRSNPFFQVNGTNARTCEACHSADMGWTITAKGMTRLFWETMGTDPVFLTHDSGSRPDADISTPAARYATWKDNLLKRGVTRFTRVIPATAEFTATAVSDPYGFSTPAQISAFRRPTPTVNEAKHVSTGWNGGPHDVATQVTNTARGATTFHLQRPATDPLPQAQAEAMRDFQMGLFFAQKYARDAGRLDAGGAKGGPTHLMNQPFAVGNNDILSPTFTRKVFDLYDAWAVYDRGYRPRGRTDDDYRPNARLAAARASIYRGQEIFNHYEFPVSGVTGLNDLLGQPTVQATCSTCHNVPNVGGHAVFRMFDLGTADEPNCGADLPLITLTHKTTGQNRVVCDMGRGLTSGKWVDIGGFRAPPLRGLPGRAPYFHDGQARDIQAVIKYYDRRFNMRLTSAQKRDLEAFLGAL